MDHPAAPEAAPVQRRGPFETLAAPSFRALWLNTVVFSVVQSMQRFAYVWLVLVLGGGPTEAGVAGFVVGIPVMVLALPAGALADRVDRRSLIVWSQVGALVVSAVTAVLIRTGDITIGVSYLLAAALGATAALGVPVRQAIVPSIVGPSRLQNAIALMSIAMNVSLILGPALGGGLISAVGLANAFTAQAALYAIALLTLRGLQIPDVVRATSRRMAADIGEGLSFIVRNAGIRTLMLLLMMSGLLMIGPFSALLPVVARDRFGADAFGASLLFTALGIGMFSTSLLLAGWRDISRKGLVFTANLILGGTGFAAFGLSPAYWLTAIIMFVWGMGGGLFVNLNQTLIQKHTPHELMGRVMSVHTMSFQGVGPVGALLGGAGAAAVGATTWIVGCGVFIVATAVVTLITQPAIRRLT